MTLAALVCAALLFWTPVADADAISIHIVDPPVFEAQRLLRGLAPGTRAFALLWPPGHARAGTCEIWLPAGVLYLTPHERRHCHEGPYHK